MKARVYSAMRRGPRNKQEDCLLIGMDIFQADELEKQTEIEAEALIFAACDGLGGHQAGDMASCFACKQLRAKYQANAFQPDTVSQVLKNIQYASQYQLPANCGTTLAGIYATPQVICVFNTGDSRVYRLDKHTAQYLSHDHSVVQELIDNYVILQETAQYHPYRHLVEFGIGPLFMNSWENHSVYVHTEPYTASTTFLLCTDGLSDQLNAAEIHQYQMPTALEKGKTLLSAVCKKGLVDNTSFIIVQFI